jgi:hypothetical protein
MRRNKQVIQLVGQETHSDAGLLGYLIQSPSVQSSLFQHGPLNWYAHDVPPPIESLFSESIQVTPFHFFFFFFSDLQLLQCA